MFWLTSYSFFKCVGKSLDCLWLDAIFMYFLSILKKDVKVSDMKHKHPIIIQMTTATILHYITDFYSTNNDFVLIVLRYPLKRMQCHEHNSIFHQWQLPEVTSPASFSEQIVCATEITIKRSSCLFFSLTFLC